MSVYRRIVQTRQSQRWQPREGTWVDCEYDEPTTRVRGPKEGMIAYPVDSFDDGPPVVPIEGLIAALARKTDTPLVVEGRT